MWQKISSALLLGLALAAAAPAQAAPADAAQFISDLGDQAIHILQTENSLVARKNSFTTLFTEDFDVPAIGKFVLGRYWRVATPQERQQYLQVFGKYIVALYSERFSSYSGQQFKVLSSRAGGDAITTVNSQIIRTNGQPPVDVEWQVAREGTGYKITDVMVEHLSMALTERDDFASVINQNGGSVAALIKALRQKVETG